MKRILSCLLAAALLAGCSAPASTTSSADAQPASADKLRVVTTIFPVYDWVRQVAGENADDLELTMLLDGSTDLHSFQPSAKDIADIADSSRASSAQASDAPPT